MKNLFLLLSVVILLGCRASRPIKLVFYEEKKSDLNSSFSNNNYTAVYIISNYCSSYKCEKIIDSLAIALGNSKKYDRYLLQLYRESSITNLKNLSKTPRDMDRYSDLNDHVLDYRWYGGKFASKTKYKNGEIDADPNVTLAPPPLQK